MIRILAALTLRFGDVTEPNAEVAGQKIACFSKNEFLTTRYGFPKIFLQLRVVVPPACVGIRPDPGSGNTVRQRLFDQFGPAGGGISDEPQIAEWGTSYACFITEEGRKYHHRRHGDRHDHRSARRQGAPWNSGPPGCACPSTRSPGSNLAGKYQDFFPLHRRRCRPELIQFRLAFGTAVACQRLTECNDSGPIV